jgi:hypothetical protein
MSYYLLLGTVTAALAWLTWRIWRKTREISFVMGLLLIYYWTLYGGWSIVGDHLAGNTTARYYYLYRKLFPIELDQYYVLALLLYALFVIGVAVTVLLVAVDPGRANPRGGPLIISHPLVIGMCAVAAVLSYTIVRESIHTSVALGQSAYGVTRGGDVGPLFTLHQVLNRVAVLPAALGLAVLVSGDRPKWIAGRGNQFHLVGYLVLLAGMYGFCVVLGNKNELFAGLLAGMLFYLANARRPRVWLAASGGVLSFAFIAAVDWLRGLPVSSVWEEFSLRDLGTALVTVGSSNEAFGSHFSLYGVLRFDVPLTYGTSLVSLATSVVPRMFWPDRPWDVYPYYAESVQAVGGQGYTLHHATGWYLNFGVAGVMLGAVSWGWLWAALFNRFHQPHPRHVATRFFTILAPWVFVAGIPSLIRSGIEGYKGLAVDSFLVPTLSLALAHTALAFATRIARPAGSPARQPR